MTATGCGSARALQALRPRARACRAGAAGVSVRAPAAGRTTIHHVPFLLSTGEGGARMKGGARWSPSFARGQAIKNQEPKMCVEFRVMWTFTFIFECPLVDRRSLEGDARCRGAPAAAAKKARRCAGKRQRAAIGMAHICYKAIFTRGSCRSTA